MRKEVRDRKRERKKDKDRDRKDRSVLKER